MKSPDFRNGSSQLLTADCDSNTNSIKTLDFGTASNTTKLGRISKYFNNNSPTRRERFIQRIAAIPAQSETTNICSGRGKKKWQKSKLLAERHEPAAAAAAALDYISKAWGSGKVSESDSGSIRQRGTESQELSWSAVWAECWGSPASVTVLKKFDRAERRQKSWLVKTAARPFSQRWEEAPCAPPNTSEF